MGREYLPEKVIEKERYLTHNNDVNDRRYRNFVSPIVNAVLDDMKPLHHKGLDFGAGTGPVITKILLEKKYNIEPYDPLFLNDRRLLENQYDFIVCCEVIEHFHYPFEEFEMLYNLLEDNGCLYCMTHLYQPNIDFGTWYYKNDPTHVFFYTAKTMEFIKEEIGFQSMKIEDRLVTFKK